MTKGKKLNAKQQKFAREFLKDFNGTRAYKSVYKSKNDNNAATSASRLLRNVKVQQELSDIMHQTKLADIMDIDDIIKRLSDIASGKPLKSIFKRTNHDPKTGKDKVEFDSITIATPEVEDQLKAIEMLGRYYKIFIDVNRDLEKAKVRQAQAEAEVAEQKAKAMHDNSDNSQVIIVDDIKEAVERENRDVSDKKKH